MTLETAKRLHKHYTDLEKDGRTEEIKAQAKINREDLEKKRPELKSSPKKK